jgi:hypothetical protein
MSYKLWESEIFLARLNAHCVLFFLKMNLNSPTTVKFMNVPHTFAVQDYLLVSLFLVGCLGDLPIYNPKRVECFVIRKHYFTHI